jgi:Glutathione S-transferase, C-terminal domain
MPNTVPCGEFTVYYHEGFTGRSQGLEMMLVASKAKWKRAPWSEVKDPTCFAAPALGHDQTGKMISQTTAAAQWLGTEVGFRPPTGLRAEALKIALDIADVWSEAYKARKDANSWEEVEAFLSGRLAQFFGVLEACAKKYGKDGVLVGAKTSYCDFLLVNAIATYAPRTSLAPRARTHASAVAAIAAR